MAVKMQTCCDWKYPFQTLHYLLLNFFLTSIISFFSFSITALDFSKSLKVKATNWPHSNDDVNVSVMWGWFTHMWHKYSPSSLLISILKLKVSTFILSDSTKKNMPTEFATCQLECGEHLSLPENRVSAMICCFCQAVNLDSPSEKGKQPFSRGY